MIGSFFSADSKCRPSGRRVFSRGHTADGTLPLSSAFSLSLTRGWREGVGTGLLLVALIFVGSASAHRHARAQGPNVFPSRGQRTAANGESLQVTFQTDEPGTSIYEGGVYRGVTDEQGKLTYTLPPGRYVFETRREGYANAFSKPLVVTTQASFIFGEQTRPIIANKRETIKLLMGNKVPLPAPTPSPAASPTPKPTPVTDSTPPLVGKAIIDALLDEKEAGSFTPEKLDGLATTASLEAADKPNNMELQADAQFVRGQVALLKKNYENARAAFNAALALKSDYTLARVGLGNVYFATNDYAGAAKELKTATDVFRTATGVDPKLRKLALIRLGNAWEKLNKKDDAKKAYREADLLDDGTADSDELLARAVRLTKAKQYDEARDLLLRLAKEATPSARVFILLGDEFVRLKDSINASKYFTDATERFKESTAAELDKEKSAEAAEAYYKLSKLLIEESKLMDDFIKAKAALERAEMFDAKAQVLDAKKVPELKKDIEDKLKPKKD